MTEVATSRLLIVNADDYGLTTGVSRGILRGAEQGIVTSTSVLAIAPAFEATVGWLRDADLGTGAHLAAVGEDPPVLSAREIPTLVGRRGGFATSWREFLPRFAAGRIDPADLRREFHAQLGRLKGAGLTLTHVDTHQHLHLWPGVAEVVLDLATGAGITAVRIIRSEARSPVGVTVRQLGRRLERRSRAIGVRYPRAATGLDDAGHLVGRLLIASIGRLAASGAATAEVVTHPGEPDDPERDRYAWGYQWADELASLCSIQAREAVDEAGFRLGTYAGLSTQ